MYSTHYLCTIITAFFFLVSQSHSFSVKSTMKAYNLYEHGPAANMKLEDVDKPTIGDEEVLIETKAISINPVDYKVRAVSDLAGMICGSTDKPLVLGWDVAGVVTEVGSKVTSLKVGDKVFGMVNFLGVGKVYADYVAAPADQLATIPDNMSFNEAAATTLAALTPLQAMQSRVKEGDTVFIHAGSGGTGHFAIQIAKALGAAKVITTSSAKNKDFCMSLGADEHIDYRACKFEEVAKDVDFCLESMGGDNILPSCKILKDGGKMVSLPSPEFPEGVAEYASEHDLNVEFIMVSSSGADMATLKGMLEKGQIKPHVGQTFKFEDMVKAHEAQESGRAVGKIIVTKE